MFPTTAPGAPSAAAGDELDMFSFSANNGQKRTNNSNTPTFGTAAAAPNKENNPVPESNPIPSSWKPSSGPVSANSFYGDAKRTIDVKPYKNPYNPTTFGGVGGKRKSAEPLQPSDVMNRSNSSSGTFGQSNGGFGQSGGGGGFGQSQSSNSSTGRGPSSKRYFSNPFYEFQSLLVKITNVNFHVNIFSLVHFFICNDDARHRLKKGERDPNQPTIMSMFNRNKEKSARTFFKL